MSIGNSGRTVIEIEPESKLLLYAALARDGMTLKDWFLKNVDHYMATTNQSLLSLSNGCAPSMSGVVKQPSLATSTGADT